MGHMSDIDFIPLRPTRQQGPFPNSLIIVLKIIPKNNFDKNT